MAIAYMESIRGYNYMTMGKLAEEFKYCAPTIRKRVDEIEEEIRKGRYIPQAIIRGSDVRVNVYVFIDYMRYRDMLRDKNARKEVPPFTGETARRIADICGYFQHPVTMDEVMEEYREESIRTMMEERGGAGIGKMQGMRRRLQNR